MQQKTQNYGLAHGPNIKEFINSVGAFLQSGYQPLGAPFFSVENAGKDGVYCQAMIQYFDDSSKEKPADVVEAAPVTPTAEEEAVKGE